MSSQIRSDDSQIGANPAPLGYAGLALAAGLFGALNVGRFHAGGLFFPSMALLYGGLATLIAAILAYRNRDTFELTVFGSFSAFWGGLGVVFLINALGHPAVTVLSGNGITWFWFIWAIVATYMLIASFRVNGAVVLFLLLMAAMFWALWIGMLVGSATGTGWSALAGWLGWGAAVVAGYTSFAELINWTFGRVILPEFPASQIQAMQH